MSVPKKLTKVQLLIVLFDRLKWPAPTHIEEAENSLYFTHASHQYWISNRYPIEVLEVEDEKVFRSDHSLYLEGLLNGGVRDDSGTLIQDPKQVQLLFPFITEE